MFKSLLSSCLACGLFIGASIAAAEDPIYLTSEDAGTAGQDFTMQGEYVSEGAKADRLGVQVVALGDMGFLWVEYKGGLPGAGAEGPAVQRIEAKTDGDGRVVFDRPDGSKGHLAAEGLVIQNGNGRKIRFRKVERKSPTLGKKPPAGAVVLFDGKDASQWDNGRMSDDGLLMEGCTSKRKFGDHTIHLEFRTSFRPFARGQNRGNSGVYMQSRYETQVLDSFGLEGKMDETGGIYSVKAPGVNMCLPPLSWQTYDIEFTAARFDESGKKVKNARITAYLNGVKVQDDVEVPHATTAAPLPEGAEPGPLYLQDHSTPTRYRNVWVVER